MCAAAGRAWAASGSEGGRPISGAADAGFLARRGAIRQRGPVPPMAPMRLPPQSAAQPSPVQRWAWRPHHMHRPPARHTKTHAGQPDQTRQSHRVCPTLPGPCSPSPPSPLRASPPSRLSVRAAFLSRLTPAGQSRATARQNTQTPPRPPKQTASVWCCRSPWRVDHTNDEKQPCLFVCCHRCPSRPSFPSAGATANRCAGHVEPGVRGAQRACAVEPARCRHRSSVHAATLAPSRARGGSCPLSWLSMSPAPRVPQRAHPSQQMPSFARLRIATPSSIYRQRAQTLLFLHCMAGFTSSRIYFDCPGGVAAGQPPVAAALLGPVKNVTKTMCVCRKFFALAASEATGFALWHAPSPRASQTSPRPVGKTAALCHALLLQGGRRASAREEEAILSAVLHGATA